MANIEVKTDKRQGNNIYLTSDTKRLANIDVYAISTKAGKIETQSFIGPKGDKGDTAYPEWGNITGDIDNQADLIERLNSLTAGQTEWGKITGDISNQEDLIEQLNAKADIDEVSQLILDRANTMIDLTQEE